MRIEDLRNILRRKVSADTDRFQIIKEVEMLVVTEQTNIRFLFHFYNS